MRGRNSVLSAVLGAAVALGGCATNKPLPVDKVVLDWKDFHPINFTPFDDCNTYKPNNNGMEYQKKLCYEDRSSLIGERYYLVVIVEKYGIYSEKWKNLNNFLSKKNQTYKSIIDTTFFQGTSKLVCKSGYRLIGSNGFRCTSIESPNEDILFVYDFTKNPSGKVALAALMRVIEKERVVTESSAPYQTAMDIISPENLNGFL